MRDFQGVQEPVTDLTCDRGARGRGSVGGASWRYRSSRSELNIAPQPRLIPAACTRAASRAVTLALREEAAERTERTAQPKVGAPARREQRRCRVAAQVIRIDARKGVWLRLFLEIPHARRHRRVVKAAHAG